MMPWLRDSSARTPSEARFEELEGSVFPDHDLVGEPDIGTRRGTPGTGGTGWF